MFRRKCFQLHFDLKIEINSPSKSAFFLNQITGHFRLFNKFSPQKLKVAHVYDPVARITFIKKIIVLASYSLASIVPIDQLQFGVEIEKKG